jgi:hypothetical protein
MLTMVEDFGCKVHCGNKMAFVFKDAAHQGDQIGRIFAY